MTDNAKQCSSPEDFTSRSASDDQRFLKHTAVIIPAMNDEQLLRYNRQIMLPQIGEMAARLARSSAVRLFDDHAEVEEDPIAEQRVLLRWLKKSSADAGYLRWSQIEQVVLNLARNAIQVLGGYGYVSEYAVERLWRDAKLLEIGGGTLEAHQKNMTRDLARLERLL